MVLHDGVFYAYRDGARRTRLETRCRFSAGASWIGLAGASRALELGGTLVGGATGPLELDGTLVGMLVGGGATGPLELVGTLVGSGATWSIELGSGRVGVGGAAMSALELELVNTLGCKRCSTFVDGSGVASALALDAAAGATAAAGAAATSSTAAAAATGGCCGRGAGVVDTGVAGASDSSSLAGGTMGCSKWSMCIMYSTSTMFCRPGI